MCQDMSSPTDEITHSVTCKYTIEMIVGNGPMVGVLELKQKLNFFNISIIGQFADGFCSESSIMIMS